MNVASRMESNSAANRILCNRETSKILRAQAPELDVTQRGVVNVKGKGDMVTYWVDRGSDVRQGYSIRSQDDSAKDLETRVRNYTSKSPGSGNIGTASWGSFGMESGKAPNMNSWLKK